MSMDKSGERNFGHSQNRDTSTFLMCSSVLSRERRGQQDQFKSKDCIPHHASLPASFVLALLLSQWYLVSFENHVHFDKMYSKVTAEEEYRFHQLVSQARFSVHSTAVTWKKVER